MSQNDIFADTFNGIAVTGNLVRIDLATLVPETGGQNVPPQFETRQRLVMPIDGFLRAFALSEDVMKKMMAAGIVTQRGTQPPQAAATTIAAPAATPAKEAKAGKEAKEGKPSSPNFN
ncbi:MAG: hypothetical protein FD157_1059 [Rhodocyclaceae bacterium]|nr:MAG: hypothetical protein FD157_1059 [Rhodocyclaceae bacterium]TND06085.1 MAG: hypothetical protein FD118_157 [Rhodocyclaceae bacterium]